MLPHNDYDNNWIKFSAASPSSSKKISAFVSNSGNYHTISFDWKVDGSYSEFFRIKFGLDGNWAYCDSSPFFKNIDDGNTIHKLEWVLEHDERTHVGTPPTASAHIGNIELCGLIFEKNGTLIPPDNPPTFKQLMPYPSNGSILDSYSLGIEVENIAAGSEIRLLTLEEPAAGWNIKETRIFNGSFNIIKFDNILFNSWGEVKFKFSCGSELYSQEGVIKISPVFVDPVEGSNKDQYLYNISGVNSSNEEVILKIKDSDDSQWIQFGRPALKEGNLTFVVPNLDFIQTLLLGTDIEYKFVIGDREIGPFKGPHVGDIFKNSRMDPNDGTFVIDFQSERCGQGICMKYNSHTTSKQIYSTCGGWQTLKFNGLDLSSLNYDHGEPNIELVECNE